MTADFVENLGLPFLAHRLRRVSDLIIDEAGAVFRAQGIALPPRGGSLVMLLAEAGRLPITEAAKRLRLSHPLIITLSRTLEEEGFVLADIDPEDRRRRLVRLTKKGRDLAGTLHEINRALTLTYEEIFNEAGIDLFAAVRGFEAAAQHRSVALRLTAHLSKAHGAGRKPK